MKEEEIIEEVTRRDRLVAEWILKIASLEKLLISKGIIEERELAETYVDSLSKMNEFIKAMQKNKN